MHLIPVRSVRLSTDGDQRITRGMTSLALENRYEKTSGALSIFYNWGNHWINDGYTPSAGESPQDSRFLSHDNMTGISLYQSTRFFQGNRITLGFDWFRYGGHAWNEYVSGSQAGTTSELVDKHEDELAGYIDFRQDFNTWLTLNAGLRVDHHSRIGTEWVPQAGLAFHLPHTMELKASASKGFRYPILREMYMFPSQNPDLQPESMWNYELAFSQRLLNGRLNYGINLFYIDGKNLILTLPNPNGSGMLNQNSGEIENTGIEVQAAFRINRHWSVDGNYSYLHMKEPVVAAPGHKLYAGTNFLTWPMEPVNRYAIYRRTLYPDRSDHNRKLRVVESPRFFSGYTLARPLGPRREPVSPTLRNQCRLSHATSYDNGRDQSQPSSLFPINLYLCINFNTMYI